MNLVFNQHFIHDTISIGDFHAYVIESEETPLYLFDNESVLNVEEDHEISLDLGLINAYNEEPKLDGGLNKKYAVQGAPCWNLDRIDQRQPLLDQKYFYSESAGANTDVYVIDTGIDINHPEFEGRAKFARNFIDGIDKDLNGHGTHVAGSVASKTYGVAKKANLIAVKVLDQNGSGSYSAVLKGMEFVFNERKKNNRISIINMSLGGPKSSAIDKAIDNLDSAGIFIVVAGGNENADSCLTSPGSNPKVTTVGATTEKNTKAMFSNWGKCVNILAPGTNIISTFPGNKTQNLQGTSQASPHVAGFYSLILSDNPALTPDAMRRLSSSMCSKDAIAGFSKDTPNCLVFTLV
jgi:subtilisin family serine protease